MVDWHVFSLQVRSSCTKPTGTFRRDEQRRPWGERITLIQKLRQRPRPISMRRSKSCAAKVHMSDHIVGLSRESVTMQSSQETMGGVDVFEQHASSPQPDRENSLVAYPACLLLVWPTAYSPAHHETDCDSPRSSGQKTCDSFMSPSLGLSTKDPPSDGILIIPCL